MHVAFINTSKSYTKLQFPQNSLMSAYIEMAEKPTKMEEAVQKETAKICFGCKQVVSSSRVYCGKLRWFVDSFSLVLGALYQTVSFQRIQ